MSTLTVHIVDDEPDVRESCQFLVSALNYPTALWEDGRAFIEGVDLTLPAIAIVDLRMPKMSGDTVITMLKNHQSPIGAIILTGHGEVSTAVKTLKEGAVDFLEKPIDLDTLMNALKNAEKVTLARAKHNELLSRYARLTEREQQIAALVYEGLTNKEIAQRESISVRTVEVQRASAMKKLETESLAEFISTLNEVDNLLKPSE
ncbi:MULTISPECIES: response regulator transcription factor [Ignatzschineria]|uniref:DNA-binding response regulator n=1 Tax=Ignatzschineria cameli TaxID=2182793 RepID=A0A2U2AKK3_9GAMM|nr:MULTISPECIES: response regulator [Ignatzschineria]MDM1545668.1 response regulator transcription factor [Ignatzschineria indica]PWD83479.1 DNA-binding response regulator [Ignatzschineria cameli]PWD88472.1 DNA-binding response regulator [Ignatzschineria cameli]PWD89078.1 DNA-binding response regulator [Ignatzschineria cameli]PWD89737.1 DNA-binding response regulator [Ignatzschineria cameli]